MIALLLLALLLACSGDPQPAPTLTTWPTEPEATLAACEAEPFPELATTCRVQAAARFAQQGRTDEAGATCALVPAGTWRQECHFRVGEELASVGQAAAAVAWCGQAGWFARRCVTHAAWRLTLPEGLGPEAGAEALSADLSELLDLVEAGLGQHEDPGVAGEGRNAFQAAWGRAVYRGTGTADPTPSKQEGDAGPALRSGWATEAVRLRPAPPGPDSAGELLVAWQAGTVLRGLPDDSPPPERYSPLLLGPHDQGRPHLPLYGGGLRLVGESSDEDALVAVLEALYGDPRSGSAVFTPWVEDPRPTVRWTAAKLAALSSWEEESGAAVREQLAADEDPVVQWMAARARPQRGPEGQR